MSAITAAHTAPPFLTTDQLAERWQVAAGSLRNDRSAGRGPAFVKLGASVRYHLNDVLAFEAASRRGAGA